MDSVKVYSYFERPPSPGLDCSLDPSRTKQSFAEESDINFIMARYMETGQLDPLVVQQREAAFGDFSDGLDFMGAMNRVVEGQAAFGTLSSKVRERFRNDPALLLEFLGDDGNRAEAESLGLVAKVVPASTPAPAGAPENAPASAVVVEPGKAGA